MYQGISLTQAPPFGVVVGFFLNAFFYLMVLACFTLIRAPFYPIMIHIMTIGFLASVMFGALSQMLPVLAGVRLGFPRVNAFISIICMNIGLIAFFAGFAGVRFYFDFSPFVIAIFAFFIGIFSFIVSIFVSAFRIRHFTATIIYMLAAVVCLCALAVLGIMMLGVYAGLWDIENLIFLRTLHRQLAIFGWVFLLIVGVSLQVMPMFYITPAFPKWFSHALVPFVYLCMMIVRIWQYLDSRNDFVIIANILLSVMCVVFGILALRRLGAKKRKAPDSSLFLWFVGLISLVIYGLFIMLSHFLPFFEWLDYLKNLCLIIFAVSIVFAMIFKIIPFLAWFHLSYEGIMKLPNMRDFISNQQIKIFNIFYALTLFFSLFVFCGIKLWGISIAMLSVGIFALGGFGFYLIIKSYLKYRHISRNGEKMRF